ncbi:MULTISPECIES: hypothetical protein [Streptomyces]|uniref:Uncharacterized protein n=1 Tax=Streptomyces lonegramiae TaxID=3075524 RepID=A0ABU2X5S5_9ACTN|nr:hypothetical protein [Streptomyces sp. DSM 41529]MDT0541167.1 hypothetical protein [Streptomyces sp. DSM 41529]
MSSDRKQTQLRLAPDVLAAGKDAAAARGLDFNRYVERLITEDTTGVRAAGMAAAQRLLERSNLTVACAVVVMYLNASGIPADPTREQLTALAHQLYDPRCTAAHIAEQLRTWRP